MKRISILACLPALVMMTACDWQNERASPVPVWARESTIEALGRAYIEVLPNRAQFSVTFEARDPDSAAASALVVEQANAATAAIRNVTDGSVRVTSNLAVNPYYEQILQQQSEFREVLVENRHPDALLGYVARVTMTVNVVDLDQTAAARGAALAAGPTSSAQVRFYMEPTAELYREAFAAAVSDATERARLVAEASGGTLGDLQILLEGQAPCLRPPSTPAGVDNGGRGQLAQNEDGEMIVVTGSRISRTGTVAPSPISNVSDEQLSVVNTVNTEAFSEVQRLSESAEQFALAADFEPMHFESRVCAVFAVR
jgi:uncharacterized protein YggE